MTRLLRLLEEVRSRVLEYSLLCQRILEGSHPQHNEGHPGHDHDPAGDCDVVEQERARTDGRHLPQGQGQEGAKRHPYCAGAYKPCSSNSALYQRQVWQCFPEKCTVL